jgi:ankyrin repeat protein
MQLLFVLNEIDPQDMKLALDNLPTELTELYSKIIMRIRARGGKHEPKALQILSWVFYSARVLTMKELQEALSIRLQQRDLVPRAQMMHADTIIEICQSLIVQSKGNGRVRLAHSTVHEYLVSSHVSLLSRSGLATSCLTYLMFDEFKNGPCINFASFKTRIEKYSFVDYVARYWPSYVTGQGESDDALQKLIFQLLQCPPATESMLQVRAFVVAGIPQNRLESGRWFTAGQSSFHILADLGLTTLLTSILRDPTQKGPMDCSDSTFLPSEAILNLVDSEGRTLLHVGAENKDIEFLESLLHFGATVDLKDKDGKTALVRAAGRGYRPVVELLLRHTDASKKQETARAAYAEALYWGHDELANALSQDYGPFQKSVEMVHVDRLEYEQFPLDEMEEFFNTDISAQDEQGETALHRAAREGYRATVKVTLHPAMVKDMEARRPEELGEGWNGLFDTVRTPLSGEPISVSLTDGRSLISIKNHLNQTALHVAAEAGHKAALQLLIASNRGLNEEEDVNRHTPLHLAAMNGHTEVVRFLIDEGANKFGAVCLAAGQGDLEAVRILLEAITDGLERGNFVQQVTTEMEELFAVLDEQVSAFDEVY